MTIRVFVGHWPASVVCRRGTRAHQQPCVRSHAGAAVRRPLRTNATADATSSPDECARQPAQKLTFPTNSGHSRRGYLRVGISFIAPALTVFLIMSAEFPSSLSTAFMDPRMAPPGGDGGRSRGRPRRAARYDFKAVRGPCRTFGNAGVEDELDAGAYQPSVRFLGMGGSG